MKRMLRVLALTFVTPAFAQQQAPSNSPPYTTPPTFPDGRQQQMPPDTKAPPPRGPSAARVEQQQIQDKLKSEPGLANTVIGVKAKAKSVMLTGSVDTEKQRDLALRIAQSYAGDRKVADKIKIRGEVIRN